MYLYKTITQENARKTYHFINALFIQHAVN